MTQDAHPIPRLAANQFVMPHSIVLNPPRPKVDWAAFTDRTIRHVMADGTAARHVLATLNQESKEPDPARSKGAGTEAATQMRRKAGLPATWISWANHFPPTLRAHLAAAPQAVSPLAGLPFEIWAAIRDAWTHAHAPRTPATEALYAKVALRLARDGQLPGDKVTRSRGSHDQYRAAFRYVASLGILRGASSLWSLQHEVTELSGARLEERWAKYLCYLQCLVALTMHCREEEWTAARARWDKEADTRDARKSMDAAEVSDAGRAPNAQSGHRSPTSEGSSAKPSAPTRIRVGRRSQRQQLRHLPRGWLARLIGEMPVNSAYGLAVRVAATFGARPAELCGAGLRVRALGHPWLEATIRCAKVRAGEAPRWRHVRVAADPGHLAAEQMLALIPADGDARGERTIAIKDARKFCDAVRAASRRAFPRLERPITPYTFRHLFAANAKAGKVMVTDGGEGNGEGDGPWAMAIEAIGDDSDVQVPTGWGGAAAEHHEIRGVDRMPARFPGPRQRNMASRRAVAAALGHGSLHSQSHYGTRRQGNGRLRWHAEMTSTSEAPLVTKLGWQPGLGLDAATEFDTSVNIADGLPTLNHPPHHQTFTPRRR